MLGLPSPPPTVTSPINGISARHFLYSLSAETETLIISRGAKYNYCFPPRPFKSGLNHCGPNSFPPSVFCNFYWSQCKHFSRRTKFMERGIAKSLATPKRRPAKTLRSRLLLSSYIKRDSKDVGKVPSGSFAALFWSSAVSGRSWESLISLTLLLNLTVYTTSTIF